ncbi:MAG: peptidoglycan-binding protein [Alphaproteobacteria bacterium]|nr:peptidoglycan-binding protein [Alphaproteobacteria bacterium]
MTDIAVGATGAAVRRIQKRLEALGFSPGDIDGKFGLGTEAAVLAFQRASGLLADGIVGARTLAALFPDAKPPVAIACPDVLAHCTPIAVSKMFPVTPIGHIKSHLPDVLSGLAGDRLTDRPMALMALATIRAETEGFVPIDEGRSRFNTSPNGDAFDLYDFRTDIGNNAKGDGARLKGRGFVQLTGRDNDRCIGAELGVDLEKNPARANESALAGRILARFLLRKERAIKEALLDHDCRAARRLVNGGSHGLDRFTDAFERGLDLVPER